jgi:cyclic beta-1,2-glucan synthetase
MTADITLTNGRYQIRITATGAGASSLGGMLLTRGGDDPTRDADGWFFYLRDLDRGTRWSAGYQPIQRAPERYAVHSDARFATILRVDDGIEVRTDITVRPDADVEWRRLTITNLGDTARRLEATSYAEVVLASRASDAGHPAFSKLFVQTDALPSLGGLLARRRPRGADESPVWMAQAIISAAPALGVETDRARFLGRGRSMADPVALDAGQSLSGTVGNVLDPVFAMRRAIELAPHGQVVLYAVMTAGGDRAAIEASLANAHAPGQATAVFASLADAPEWTPVTFPAPGPFAAARGLVAPAPGTDPLQFSNGYGGFSAAGDEYVIRLDRTAVGLHRPPLPWTNVLANESTGFIASEAGLGFTWSGNSRLNRLTPWRNDPVADPTGEALYIRDEADGVFWSPTPAPTPGAGGYETRHGFGETTWSHESAGLRQEVTAFVALHDPVKIIRLRITNDGTARRRLSVWYYAEWVLGSARAETAGQVITEVDGGLLLATNPRNGPFAGRVAFAASIGSPQETVAVTTDRLVFLGRYGRPEAPAALTHAVALDGRVGAGLDPCAAFQRMVDVAPGTTAEWSFLLGQAADRDEVFAIRDRFATSAAIEAERRRVRDSWRSLLSGVQVETPVPEIDLMLNGWLTYQNLACRMWARSAFYQSGGAFGYRDQLQDSSAMVHLAPEVMRRQLLLHGAHQFLEGDVLHWWHPPATVGIRTRFADDLLWLPYLTAHYLRVTGDAAVLEESLEFLTAPLLTEGHDEAMVQPERSGVAADLYEHCARAIDRSLAVGAHGLPLMGSGDWNDGMNRVGRLGRGESVWLGFFLYGILEQFIPIARDRGDASRVTRYTEHRRALETAVNDGGWDGEWYRRAYYDDGAPLGSSGNDECRIDLLAQAWAVLSGAAPADRAALALAAMEQHLVDEPAGIIRLLTPPFDVTSHDPGYIKGYLPGVRENGGQYTHAALWAVRALAEAGATERAADLFAMLSPVQRGGSAEAIARYLTEPYVIAADVYGVAPHLGRGGWTWYTGSAGWMFRVGLESILGFGVEDGRTLVMRPCIPDDWPGFTIRYRHPGSRAEYRIVVSRSTTATRVQVDGVAVIVVGGSVRIPLVEAGRHVVEIALGADLRPRYQPRPAAG